MEMEWQKTRHRFFPKLGRFLEEILEINSAHCQNVEDGKRLVYGFMQAFQEQGMVME